MGRRERDADIRRLAKEIIGEVAPGDLPSFDVQADAYFAHRRHFRDGNHRDRPNEFDGTVTAILVVLVLKIVDRVLDSATDRAIDSVLRRIRQWLGRRSAERPVESQQLDELIADELRAYDELTPERAAELAASIRSAVERHIDPGRRRDGSD